MRLFSLKSTLFTQHYNSLTLDADALETATGSETHGRPLAHRGNDGGLPASGGHSNPQASSPDQMPTPSAFDQSQATETPTVEGVPPQDRIDTLLWPLQAPVTIWNTTAQAPVTFTYQFESGPPPDLVGSWTYSNWSSFSSAEKDAVRSALAEYAEILNVRFVEVTGQADPDINFGHAELGPGLGGISFFNYSYFVNGLGQVTSKSIDASVVYDDDQNLLTNRNLILHEIGHALTLKHPGNYDAAGGTTPGPFLPLLEDNSRYTVMSYNANPDNSAFSDHPMLYDIAALQYRFGANMTTRTGDDVYTGPNGLVQTIWDAGGVDTISGAARTTPLSIDLREGTFSSLGALNNLSIAYGVLIENAVGGSAGDTLRGNDANNIFTGNGGGDAIDGGLGDDMAAYDNSSSGVSVDLQANTATGGDAVGDTLTNVEGLSGSALNDQLFGDANANRLFGNGGADFIQGRGGADNIQGGDGDDWLDGGTGGDTINGGNGALDIAAYGGSNAAVNLDLQANTYSGGDAAGDVLSNVEGLSGSSFADQLFGDGNDQTVNLDLQANTYCLAKAAMRTDCLAKAATTSYRAAAATTSSTAAMATTGSTVARALTKFLAAMARTTSWPTAHPTQR